MSLYYGVQTLVENHVSSAVHLTRRSLIRGYFVCVADGAAAMAGSAVIGMCVNCFVIVVNMQPLCGYYIGQRVLAGTTS